MRPAAFHAVLLPDTRELFAIYGEQTAAGFDVWGYYHATESADSGNGIYKASGTDPWFEALGTVDIDARYVNGQSLTGVVSMADGDKVDLLGTPTPASRYVFDQPADLAKAAGTWALTDGEASGDVTIGSDGGFTGDVDGCGFRGRLTAAPTFNVFRTTLDFSGAACLLDGQTATGLTLMVRDDSGKDQLIIVGHDTTRQLGGYLYGVR